MIQVFDKTSDIRYIRQVKGQKRINSGVPLKTENWASLMMLWSHT